jgi:hypothetical protein
MAVGQLSAAVAFIMLAACTPGAPVSVPTTPTIQAAATTAVAAASPAAATAAAAASPIAATVAAAASPAAATVVAGASPAAATAVAGASPAATTIAAAASPVATQAGAAASPAAATAAAAAPLRISGVNLNPTDPTLQMLHTGTTALDLTGYRVRAGSATAAMPANSRVEPGQTFNVHLGSGTSSGSDIYLGQEGAALLSGLQPGAQVAVLNPQGGVVTEFTVPGR